MSLSRLLFHAGFAALYVALDAASFIHPIHGLNITPWNPAPALGLAYLLRQGRAGWLPLAATVVLSEWLVRGIPQSWWTSLLSALLLGAGYIALGEAIRRFLHQRLLVEDRAGLLRWALLVFAGAFLVSTLYLSSLRLLGLLPGAGFGLAVFQFWIGDGIGIAVAMPLFVWLGDERGRRALREALLQWETLGYVLLSFVLMYLVFGPGVSGFRLFYLLFVPLVWASARQGMAGAILSASLLQIEIIVAVQLLDYSAVTVLELQLLSLAMVLIGFFIGCVVDEQRRTSEELKQTLRLAAASEMAGALAHELNQPLTALAAYASACEVLLERGEAGQRLATAVGGLLQEAGRASDVVRRLRDFFRTGATKLEPVGLRELVRQAARQQEARAGALDIDFRVGELPDVPLLVDRLQLEVVLRNLLANAFEAAVQAPAGARRVTLQAGVLPQNRVCVVVEDSGGGLTQADQARLFEPFVSTKSSGLGLGLAISRAIVEAHGGKLWGEVADHGVFRMILPIQDSRA